LPVGREGELIAKAADLLGPFASTTKLFRFAARDKGLSLNELRPQWGSSLRKLALKPTAPGVAILREAHGRISDILKAADGRPLSEEELRRAVDDINPTGGTSNCMECTLAVDDLLAGRASVAVEMRDGVDPEALPEILGDRLASRLPDDYDFADIERYYQDAGPGARGVFHGYLHDPEGGPGIHIGNVANIDNKVYYIDGSNGWVEPYERVSDVYGTGGSIRTG
jgi:Papain fold toxin 1, glutamine deamidase